MKQFVTALCIMFSFTGCDKESEEEREAAFPIDIQQQLTGHNWVHYLPIRDTYRLYYDYSPAECELDNVYKFTFSKGSVLKVITGDKPCIKNAGEFEQLFNGKNQISLSYDKALKSLVFNGDKYVSYRVFIDHDKLILFFHSSNPLIDYIPTEYHFKAEK